MNHSRLLAPLRRRRLFTVFGLAFTFCLSGILFANEDEGDDKTLVQQALQAELDGDSETRQRLLQLAIEHDPDDSAARWLLGYVKHDDRWMLASRSAFLNAIQDEDLAEYEQLRDRLAGNLPGEVQLARWCKRNELKDRERWHWRNVLSHDRMNIEALQALKLKNFHGQLMTKEEIETYKQASDRHQQSLRVWGAKLNRLRREIKRASYDQESDAWKEISKIDDPEAIPSMVKMLPTVDLKLQRHLIGTIANMKSEVASDTLVQLSLNLTDSSARLAAAEGLAKHPIHSYAPDYLNRLESPVEFKSTMNRVGDLFVSQTLMRKERPDDAINLTKSTTASITVVDPEARDSRIHRNAVSQEIRRQRHEVASTERAVADSNQRIKFANERIFSSLRTATGEQMENVPKLWWDWWKDYNEYLVQQKPEYFFTENSYRQRRIRLRSMPAHECFPAGTLVHTETGKRAIETIRLGDKVLSQNTTTGELDYKLVLQTTLRPPSATKRITVGGEEITSTDGHPYWVIGKGWTMAKNLKVGDRLQGIGESKTVESVEDGEEVYAHNLIVDQTNAYFVGDTGLLVHDSILRSGSHIPIPGWQAKK